MGKAKTYQEMDIIAIPDPIPEIGMEAGRMGVVDTVYDGGRMLLVDASSPEGPSALVDVRLDPEPRVVGYSPLSV
jgi:hypothetical protein